jgi:hypothetical protein
MQPQTKQESAGQMAAIIGGLNGRIAAIQRELQECQRTFQHKVEDLNTRFRLLTYNLSRLESLIQDLKSRQLPTGPENPLHRSGMRA